MPVRYEPNPFYEVGIESQEQFVAGRHSIAKEVARLAKLLAPVRDAKYKRRLLPGVYKRRIKAVLDGVAVTDPYWHFVEYGTVHSRPNGTLRRAVRAAGLRLVTLPKQH